MLDRSIRSLEHLETSASTSRVLNLRAVALRKANDPDHQARPMFQCAALNSAIVVKHRLRADELDHFAQVRSTATKILVPIEARELRLGARYVFVGQRRFEQTLYEAFGIALGDENRDLRVLTVMDESPTLDPFLLREQLRRQGLEPALCYFELSAADTRRMFAFAQREIEPLVRMTVGAGDDTGAMAAKLMRKILANSADAELDPLRRTMQLDHVQFHEGVFCWKAFLYYKWQLADLLPRVNPVLQQIQSIRPRGHQSDDVKIYLASVRETLRKTLLSSCRRVKATLEIYDSAYATLTRDSDPTAFRQFLLRAPTLFNELGERLGAIEHIVSFWRYRFPGTQLPVIGPDELCDLFMDFENSLGQEPDAAETSAPSRARRAMAV